jgi:Ger(x)C family germination protein
MLTNQPFRTPVLLCIMIPLTFLVAGCWDRREIENNGFVLGVAIDYVTAPDPKGQYDLPHVTQEAGSRKYRVTYELPKFKRARPEKIGAADEHIIFSGEGESLLAISRAIAAKTYFALFFEDIQMVVFSESVAREGISDFIDYFTRNPGMRRRVKVFVTPSRAEDILKNKMQVKDVNSMYISKITRNSQMDPRFASETDLGNVSEAIRNKSAFFMPLVVMEKGNVKLTKAALFNKDTKLVGELNEWEIIGAKILRTKLTGGAFSVPNPSNSEKLAVVQIIESKTEISSHVKDDKLWFTLEAKYIGSLGENTETEQKGLDLNFQTAVEQSLAAEFTRQVEAAYYKQQEVKAEVCDLGWLVHRQHPQYWKQIKDRWDDEVFPTVPLEVNIKVVIRRPGMTD